MATGVLTASNRPLVWRYAKKTVKRVVPLALAIYFIPKVLAIYFCFGLLDVLRNKHLKLSTIDRYFFGNGVFTWLLSPFNLLMDVLTLPYLNKGIYRLGDLPLSHQAEIKTVIEAAQRRNIVGLLEQKMDGKPARDDLLQMVRQQSGDFGRNAGVSPAVSLHSHDRRLDLQQETIDRPALRPAANHLARALQCEYDRGPRSLYPGGRADPGLRDEKLFIFDDTLQHQSCNESEKIRYCLFVDILRPSLFPRLMSGILAAVRHADHPLPCRLLPPLDVFEITAGAANRWPNRH